MFWHFLIGIISSAISLFLLEYWLPKPLLKLVRYIYPDVIFKLPDPPINSKDPPMLALTIDDVPTPLITHQILDILKKHQVKCTFFLISSFGENHREIVQRMTEEGHELGNHTHVDAPSIMMSYNDFEYSFDHCHKLMSEYQLDNRWFRPGFAYFSQRMIDHIKDYDYNLVLGDSYPHDPYVRFPKINELYLRWKIEPGSIIVLHDRPWTPPLLDSLLPKLKAEGYKFVTLSEGFNKS